MSACPLDFRWPPKRLPSLRRTARRRECRPGMERLPKGDSPISADTKIGTVPLPVAHPLPVAQEVGTSPLPEEFKTEVQWLERELAADAGKGGTEIFACQANSLPRTWFGGCCSIRAVICRARS